jgi:hypothetical protein
MFTLYPQGWASGTHRDGTRVGLRTFLDDMLKRKISYSCRELNPDSSAVQPVVSRSTDWTIHQGDVNVFVVELRVCWVENEKNRQLHITTSAKHVACRNSILTTIDRLIPNMVAVFFGRNVDKLLPHYMKLHLSNLHSFAATNAESQSFTSYSSSREGKCHFVNAGVCQYDFASTSLGLTCFSTQFIIECVSLVVVKKQKWQQWTALSSSYVSAVLKKFLVEFSAVISLISENVVTWLSVARDKVCIGNWIYWTHTLVTTNNYDSLTELPTSEITITIAHIKSSQFSLAVPW